MFYYYDAVQLICTNSSVLYNEQINYIYNCFSLYIVYLMSILKIVMENVYLNDPSNTLCRYAIMPLCLYASMPHASMPLCLYAAMSLYIYFSMSLFIFINVSPLCLHASMPLYFYALCLYGIMEFSL